MELMGLMGLKKRIRAWWGQWWVSRKDFDLSSNAYAIANHARAKEAESVMQRALAAESDRRWEWFDALSNIRQTHDTVGVMLSNVLEIHAMDGCRLDALAEAIRPVVSRSQAAEGSTDLMSVPREGELILGPTDGRVLVLRPATKEPMRIIVEIRCGKNSQQYRLTRRGVRRLVDFLEQQVCEEKDRTGPADRVDGKPPP